MITKEELNALLQILQRTPMTQAEALWLNSVLVKLAPKAEEQSTPEVP